MKSKAKCAKLLDTKVLNYEIWWGFEIPQKNVCVILRHLCVILHDVLRDVVFEHINICKFFIRNCFNQPGVPKDIKVSGLSYALWKSPKNWTQRFACVCVRLRDVLRDLAGFSDPFAEKKLAGFLFTL